ncbi:MAG: hypothetical protein JKY65_28485 [Planctomycetes bacterium]|nr:hypothetical protein [Planctomycetota bacterium]
MIVGAGFAAATARASAILDDHYAWASKEILERSETGGPAALDGPWSA